MRIGICEDDPKDLARLRDFLIELRLRDSVRCFSDACSLLGAIGEGAVFDLLFLDVYLPDMKGTELAAAVREAHPVPQPSVAFITSSEDHAIQAFALGAVHYITKPFTRGEVEEALQRCARPHDLRRGISVPEGNATRFVYLDEIAMCESAGHMVTVRLNDGSTLTFRQTLGELQRSLDARFIGVSRGFVVNADFIERMGPKSCTLKDGREVLLSRGSAKEIRKAYQDYLFSRMIGRMDRAPGKRAGSSFSTRSDEV